jgi:hypothetical protein
MRGARDMRVVRVVRVVRVICVWCAWCAWCASRRYPHWRFWYLHIDRRPLVTQDDVYNGESAAQWSLCVCLFVRLFVCLFAPLSVRNSRADEPVGHTAAQRNNAQHATCNMQRSTCSVQHATLDMQRAPCSVQHATLDMQRAALPQVCHLAL